MKKVLCVLTALVVLCAIASALPSTIHFTRTDGRVATVYVKNLTTNVIVYTSNSPAWSYRITFRNGPGTYAVYDQWHYQTKYFSGSSIADPPFWYVNFN